MSTSTVITPYVSLIDSSNVKWSFDATGRVTEISARPVIDNLTGTDALALVNNVVWRHAGGMWWPQIGIRGSSISWGAPQATIPLPPDPSGTSLPIGSGNALVDTNGNLWWTAPDPSNPSSYQVVENWQVDKGTGKVSELYFDGRYIWQEAQNNSGWWEKSGTGYDGWGTQQNFVPHTYGATLTWQGPSGWSMTGAGLPPPGGSTTNGVPQIGDTLVMNTGSTMNVGNTNLANDVLHLNSGYSPGIATFNLYDNSSVNFGGYTLAGGNATVAITTIVPHVDVSLHHSTSGPSLTVTGNLSAVYGLNVTGGANDVLTNNGTITLSNSEIDAGLNGTGTYNLTRYHDGPGYLTIDGNDSVGAGLTFDLSGDVGGGFVPHMTINSPSLFDAALKVSSGTGDTITLKGMSATSYTYNGSLLALYNGDTAIETFKLTSALPVAVGSNVSDDTLYFGSAATNPLPIHPKPSVPTPTIKSVGPDSALADNITNAAALTLTGTAEANSTVTMYDGTKLGNVTAAADGSWSYTTGKLADGKHDFTATVTDSHGTSSLSNVMTMTTDTVAPAVPTISQPGSVTPVMVLNGTADPNSTVTIFNNGSAIGTAAVSNGAWSFTTGTLAVGDHTFTETATDVAGNTSAASLGITITEPTPPLANYGFTDTTTDKSGTLAGEPYHGPVAGIQSECIYLTHDNINISAYIPNVFIHSGSGQDALQALSGTNVLDGSTGSNFLLGGSGTDTFFVDDRGPSADIWSTVVGFHAGDAATIWGVTPQDFGTAWADGQGAVGYTGLTLHATGAGKPTASLTLAGFTTGDLSSGRISVVFGNDPASGSSYMYAHCNS
jgi:Bacterial Ig-like domain